MKIHPVESKTTGKQMQEKSILKVENWKNKLGNAWFDALGSQFKSYDTSHEYWNDDSWLKDDKKWF